MRKTTSLLAVLTLMLTSCCTFDRRLDQEAAVRTGVPVGARLVAKMDLVAMVVSVNYEPSKVDFVHITEEPGYGGREVLKRIRVKKGDMFEVVGARESSFPGCRRRYIVVKSEKPLEPSGAEIWLLESATEVHRVNPALFDSAP